jgi:hypothetical protein
MPRKLDRRKSFVLTETQRLFGTPLRGPMMRPRINDTIPLLDSRRRLGGLYPSITDARYFDPSSESKRKGDWIRLERDLKAKGIEPKLRRDRFGKLGGNWFEIRKNGKMLGVKDSRHLLKTLAQEAGGRGILADWQKQQQAEEGFLIEEAKKRKVKLRWGVAEKPYGFAIHSLRALRENGTEFSPQEEARIVQEIEESCALKIANLMRQQEANFNGQVLEFLRKKGYHGIVKHGKTATPYEDVVPHTWIEIFKGNFPVDEEIRADLERKFFRQYKGAS